MHIYISVRTYIQLLTFLYLNTHIIILTKKTTNNASFSSLIVENNIDYLKILHNCN